MDEKKIRLKTRIIFRHADTGEWDALGKWDVLGKESKEEKPEENKGEETPYINRE